MIYDTNQSICNHILITLSGVFSLVSLGFSGSPHHTLLGMALWQTWCATAPLQVPAKRDSAGVMRCNFWQLLGCGYLGLGKMHKSYNFKMVKYGKINYHI